MSLEAAGSKTDKKKKTYFARIFSEGIFLKHKRAILVPV